MGNIGPQKIILGSIFRGQGGEGIKGTLLHLRSPIFALKFVLCECMYDYKSLTECDSFNSTINQVLGILLIDTFMHFDCRNETLEFGGHLFHIYKMGNNYSLVINNTTQEITIKEWKKRYSKELKKTVEYCRDKGVILGPGQHACFSPAELKKAWTSRLKSTLISSEKRVSLKGKSSKEGVVLSVSEFESSIAIVFNMVGNDQLVKDSFSREEVKKTKGTKSSGKHEERNAELKKHLISIVDKGNTASTSLPQLGEEEKLDQGSKSDVAA